MDAAGSLAGGGRGGYGDSGVRCRGELGGAKIT